MEWGRAGVAAKQVGRRGERAGVFARAREKMPRVGVPVEEKLVGLREGGTGNFGIEGNCGRNAGSDEAIQWIFLMKGVGSPCIYTEAKKKDERGTRRDGRCY